VQVECLSICVCVYIWACPAPPPPGVCRLLSSVMSGTESHTDREEDYRFLHSMLMEKKLHLLFKIHERLKRFEKRSPIPVQEHAASLASELAEELIYQGRRDEVKELVALFSKPHFKSLLSVHDAVAQRDFEPTLPPFPDDVLDEDEDSVKIVSLVKTKEPLARSHGEVKFKIIPASAKEEMSSNEKKLFLRALFDYDPNEDPTVPCKDAAVAFRRGDVLQIVSMEDDTWWQACHVRSSNSRAGLIPSQQLHERCSFSLLCLASCRRVALQRPRALFKPPQAKPLGDEPTPRSRSWVSSAALLVAITAFVFSTCSTDEGEVMEDVNYGAITGIHIGPCLSFPAGLRRSFRLGRKSNRAREAARSRRWSTGIHSSVRPPTYIAVIPYHKDPKDRHRLIVLVGPCGVGVNELKRRLLISDPNRYGVTVPYTTREKRRQENEGMDYHFVSVHMFEEDILNHRFIEYGRYNGHYYGTSLDSVHRVMAEGKVCLLDVHPSKIKHVYTSEFKPYVVFVKPPRIEELRLTRRRAKFICNEEDKTSVRIFSEEDFEDMINLAEAMESQYGRMFDKVIVNGDIAVAFRELRADLEKVEEAEVQWIPA
ncbi:hypothetical protein L3Q82_021735, partial [Scortum barcoo]